MNEPALNPDGDKPSVLIADDEEMVITSIRAFLQLEAGFDIHAFTDPKKPRHLPPPTGWMWPSRTI